MGPRLPETAERLDGPRIAKLCQAAKENGCYVIAPVATEREVKGVYFNSAVLIDDEGHVAGCYDKHHLYSLERFHFRMGNDIQAVQVVLVVAAPPVQPGALPLPHG